MQHFDALSAAAESTIKSVKLVVMGEPMEKTSERKGASMLYIHFHTNESALLHSKMQKRMINSSQLAARKETATTLCWFCTHVDIGFFPFWWVSEPCLLYNK